MLQDPPLVAFTNVALSLAIGSRAQRAGALVARDPLATLKSLTELVIVKCERGDGTQSIQGFHGVGIEQIDRS